MSYRLPSYVRSRRKRWHLSQSELTFLLGLSSQALVSQHESLTRLPQSKSLVKYEILFGEPIGALFPKLYRDAGDEMMVQAQALMKLLAERPDISSARKLELLSNLIRRLDANNL